MITLSLNFNGNSNKGTKAAHQQVREVIDTHLGFPGSDKLKWGVTIKDNGDSSVSFAGPKDLVDEAKRLWHENVAPVTRSVQSSARKVAARAKRNVNAAAKKAKASVSSAKRQAKKVKVRVKVSQKKKATGRKVTRKTASRKKR